MKVKPFKILSMALIGLLCIGFNTQSSAKEKAQNRMLFAYSPGCPHCEYQRPIINRFVKNHPGLKTTTTRYHNLIPAQESLIEGTSGHPVMVFHRGDCARQVVGESSFSELESEYAAFQQQCAQGEAQKVSTGSGIVCH
ncbi:MAG: hypothetical protein ACRESZ_07725 [Methylococcales bacterium]